MKWLDRIFGASNMAALQAGATSPDFLLPLTPSQQSAAKNGDGFSLRDALKSGPVLAVFFKVSCPTCQYTFPFLQRLHEAHGGKVSIVGISQNDGKDTAAFMKQYGVTFPVLMDDPNGYATSNAYGITNVPSLFLIGQNGQIEISSVGWVKEDIEAINRQLASSHSMTPPAIFQPGEEVRDFRAG